MPGRMFAGFPDGTVVRVLGCYSHPEEPPIKTHPLSLTLSLALSVLGSVGLVVSACFLRAGYPAAVAGVAHSVAAGMIGLLGLLRSHVHVTE
jgi:hypothetical protein